MQKKKTIYYMPGLGASSRIFEFLQLPADKFEEHFLEWEMPISSKESLESYSQRIAQKVAHENPILVGVSFGGVIVQEMSRYLQTERTVIISSIKSQEELPGRLRLLKNSGLYKMIPTKKISEIEDFSVFGFHHTLKRKSELYNKYMSVRHHQYLDWAIESMLHWRKKDGTDPPLHIHGDRDEIFPIKYMQDCITVKDGTHAMILTKARKISRILIENLKDAS